MNTSQTGDVSHAAVMTALLKAGKTVLLPWGDCQRYDLVIDEGTRFLRVQVKTGRLAADGAVVKFRTSNFVNGQYKDYVGQIDLFGVYCSELDRVYLVPVEVAGKRICHLRLVSARNGQSVGTRMADDYLVHLGT